MNCMPVQDGLTKFMFQHKGDHPNTDVRGLVSPHETTYQDHPPSNGFFRQRRKGIEVFTRIPRYTHHEIADHECHGDAIGNR